MIDLLEFKSSLETARHELEEAISIDASKDRKSQIQAADDAKVFYRLGNFLHWCNAIIDRCQSMFPVGSDEMLMALRGANNAVKHNVRVIELQKYEPGGFTFPITFPFSIPAPAWEWGDLVAPGSLRHKDHEDAYNNKLKGKNLKISIETIYAQLSSMIDDVLEKGATP